MPVPDPSRRRRGPPPLSRAAPLVAAGFTLVELVVVISVLGLLAAIALPRFASLPRDARLASLQALQGAIRAAAAQGYATCMLNSGTCSLTAPASWASDTMNRVVINGVPHQFHYGFPIGWGGWNGFGAGIETMVETSGFSIQPYVGGAYLRDFQIASAPDPTRCYVRYAFPAGGSPGTYQVTLASSGC